MGLLVLDRRLDLGDHVGGDVRQAMRGLGVLGRLRHNLGHVLPFDDGVTTKSAHLMTFAMRASFVKARLPGVSDVGRL